MPKVVILLSFLQVGVRGSLAVFRRIRSGPGAALAIEHLTRLDGQIHHRHRRQATAVVWLYSMQTLR